MRKIEILVVMVAMFLSTVTVFAANKEEIKCNYVIRCLRLNKAQTAAFRPICLNYFKEQKAARVSYGNLKDKLKTKIKTGRLTDAEAAQLLNAHWNADAAETAIRKKYTELFKRSIGAKKTFEAFDYAGDSMKKITGGKKKSKEKEDEEE